MQPAIFHPAALRTLRSFPQDVRVALGSAILDLQHGAFLTLPLSRSMPSVAPGACELRVKDASGIYRAFYIVKHHRAVLVFHAFQKKTPKTPPSETQLAQKRLKELLNAKN